MSDGEAVLVEELEATIVGKPKRKMSTIEFPYYDLDNAIEIAKRVHSQVGHGSADTADVAGWLGMTITSGTFRLRMSAFRMYGLMTGERGTVKLSDVGIRIVDPTLVRQARVEAFLSVELFKALYDKFRGKLLPPPAGIENEMVGLGVTEAQKDRARQTFERSAKQAGFFEHGPDRLLAPSGGAVLSESIDDACKDDLGSRPALRATAERSNLHQLIEGLISELPPVHTEWTAKDRAKWLRAAAFNFSLIYDGEGDIRVTVSNDSSGDGGGTG